MKASPILISWHNENQPVYSTHIDAKGRLATAGGDNNVRIWKVTANGDERSVEYLSTLVRHTQAVNVARFAPKGEVLATAGDDGNALLWVPTEVREKPMGEEGPEDKESWRVKHMCRSSGQEIYDLAWSPDAVFFITGSMDNVARIYNAQNGQMVRQIAEHNHYVQGVAWDPLNEFLATQSSDRSVHIYALRNKEGEFTLNKHNAVARMDLPAGRRISASSPAPTDAGARPAAVPPPPPPPASDAAAGGPPPPASPAPSASIPGTPTSLALPSGMNPPAISHSRRSSFSSRRSASPAPSMPLPAVRPMEHSPVPFAAYGYKNASLYASETCTSFFRRLAFAPDGSLLFTPAGQFKVPPPPPPPHHHPGGALGSNGAAAAARPADDVANTVYVYTRAGLNKPPVMHLPGQKKPSIAVKCSPVYYTLRPGPPRRTVNITLDTSSADEAIPALPEAVVPTSHPSAMDPPRSADRATFPHLTMPSPKDTGRPSSSPKDPDTIPAPTGPFSLPYRMVYAVASQDAVMVYDTQHTTPICSISNLHFATFTDLAWSPDGLTLMMSSSDGFCSYLAFAPHELGAVYAGPHPTLHHPHPHPLTVTSGGGASSVQPSPVPTPTAISPPSLSRLPGPPPPLAGPPAASFAASVASTATPGPSLASPTTKSRSNSVSSVGTQASHAPGSFGAAIAGAAAGTPLPPGQSPTPTMGAVPGVTAAAGTGPTPPLTPMPGVIAGGGPGGGGAAAADGARKREGETVDGEPAKKRRIAPTPVAPTPPPPPPSA